MTRFFALSLLALGLLVVLPAQALQLDRQKYFHATERPLPTLLAEPGASALSSALPLRFQAAAADELPDDYYALPRQLLATPTRLTAAHWSVLGDQRVSHLEVRLTDARGGRLGLGLDNAPPELQVRFFAVNDTTLAVNEYQFQGGDFAAGLRRYSLLLTGQRLGAELSLPLAAPLPTDLVLRELTVLPLSDRGSARLQDASQLANASCQTEWGALRQSSVMLLISSGKLCSGNFLAAEPGKAGDHLFLYTAAHCIGSVQSATGTQAVFDVEAPCNDEFGISLATFQQRYGTRPRLGNGSLLVVGDPELENLGENDPIFLTQIQDDFSLLRFNKADLPSGASVTSLGWGNEVPDEPRSVGHALGYARSATEYRVIDVNNSPSVVRADPTLGITLPGASGSVLADSQERALGVLSAAISDAPYTTFFSTLDYALDQGLCAELSDDGTCDSDPVGSPIRENPVEALDSGGGGGGGGNLGHWSLLALLLLAVCRRTANDR